jgi:hypothetical protein
MEVSAGTSAGFTPARTMLSVLRNGRDIGYPRIAVHESSNSVSRGPQARETPWRMPTPAVNLADPTWSRFATDTLLWIAVRLKDMQQRAAGAVAR